ncbi:Sugar kinase of the NBD/HSP70 family, may contain an N-terminal HTH domain [Streptomyces sp. 2224.1]|uniref:ROK family transcriptional regulator n=1 Tax=Streptomyces sp. 2224.1 TaxID=1881020 RepID=UPI00089B0F0A|nr:ROK family protein [Streptomyces sp. 2224.1]SED92974.1 Sugar kinase of the NBD/HSP70 family, may contain an N-terminal HTH domain [Streptomyces sp. 2224.1]
MTAPGGDTQHGIRRRNLARVLRTVAAQGPLSRPAVAARIGLTRAGVAPLVDELLRAGLLVEAGRAATGGRGRPGGELAVSDRGPAGLGAEIGVDHLAVCAVDLRGRVRARVAADAANRHSAPGPVLRRLSALLAEVTDAIAVEGLRPAGLAVAVPGLVARGTTTVVHAPNLGWRAADLAPGLAGATAARDGSPALPLTVENEANLGALAELRLGGGDGQPGPPPDFVHVSAEIGIGAAVVVEGQLLRGARGFAGELGHVPVHPDGPACGCGGRGCLEQYAGEEAVLRAGGLAPGRAAAAHPGPGARIGLLARRAADGDTAVVRALHEAGTALGIALAGAVNLLDPRAVVLGGALAGLAPWILPSLERELALRAAVAADSGRADGPAVAVSRLGADGPLLGAAHAALQTVLDDPLHSSTPAHSPRNGTR